ncbi:surface lipoprotein [Burkholderiales bacterium JOSHI_001]|nr:surface lipoprotein [Burkholderiales bacterium JOSHI_001]
MKRRLSAARVLAAMVFATLLAGCATPGRDGNPRDPLEGINRAVFNFNEGVDTVVVKPVAMGYRAVLPAFVRSGVDNVFGNIGDIWSAANQFLQGKLQAGLEMTLRVAVNSTLGFGGLLDIGSEAQLPRQSEDFGQTLGRWGVAPGPYVVLPLLGPSTLRDTAARPLDLAATPGNLLFKESRDAAGATVLQFVHARAGLLDATRALDDAALDKYILVRDGYLARRRNQVYDGDPPEEGSGTR